jgi:hypothetical protein
LATVVVLEAVSAKVVSLSMKMQLKMAGMAPWVAGGTAILWEVGDEVRSQPPEAAYVSVVLRSLHLNEKQTQMPLVNVNRASTNPTLGGTEDLSELDLWSQAAEED